MGEVREIPHSDGTTTVIEHLDTGGYRVYTTDSDTDIELDGGAPWATFGDNYTFEEIVPGYTRNDDPPQAFDLQTTADSPLPDDEPAPSTVDNDQAAADTVGDASEAAGSESQPDEGDAGAGVAGGEGSEGGG